MSQDETPPDGIDAEALRRAFAARVLPPAITPCPPANDIALAAQGQLDAARMATLADHFLQCHECAEAWRLAGEFLGQPDAAMQPIVGTQRPPRWLRQGAAAATVLVFVGLAWQWRPVHEGVPGHSTAPEPSYRDGSPRADVQPLNNPTLPREDFLLRWQSAAPDARWTVRLFTADLTPVFVAEDVAGQALRVPPSALAGASPGSSLLWQVEGRTNAGAQLRSPTFEVRIDPAAGGK